MMQVTERSVIIEHSDEGSSVQIEDPSGTELLALAMILGALLLIFWKRKKR